jgi:hypothetical protein
MQEIMSVNILMLFSSILSLYQDVWVSVSQDIHNNIVKNLGDRNWKLLKIMELRDILLKTWTNKREGGGLHLEAIRGEALTQMCGTVTTFVKGRTNMINKITHTNKVKS